MGLGNPDGASADTVDAARFAVPVIVLLPFYVKEKLGGGPEWYGFLLAGMGAGSLIGLIVAGVLRVPDERRGVYLIGLLSAMGLAIGLLGFQTHRWLALGLFLVVGCTTGIFNILILTIFQLTTASELRGRVMSFVMTLAMAIAPVGMMLGGVLGDLSGKDVTLIYPFCGAAIVVLTLLLGAHRDLHEFLGFELSKAD